MIPAGDLRATMLGPRAVKLPGLYGARSIESGRAAGYFVDEMLAWAAEGSLVPISGLGAFQGS